MTPAERFRWTGGSGALRTFNLSTGGPPIVTVYTTATELVLPDLRAVGIALAPSTPYRWTVEAIETSATVDAVASSERPEACSATSAPRTFTTAPTP